MKEMNGKERREGRAVNMRGHKERRGKEMWGKSLAPNLNFWIRPGGRLTP